MKSRRRKKSLFGRIIDGHRRRVGMAMSIYGGIATLVVLAGVGWNARDVVITRPEVVKLHADQENEIAENRAGVQYFRQAQIANLYRELGAINERIRQGRATAADIERKKDIQSELRALTGKDSK